MTTKKTYLKLGIRLVSPLAIGSGKNASTDSDVILDSNFQPIITATSLAGTIRHFLKDTVNCDDQIWGTIDGDNAVASRIRFYDGLPVSDSFVTIRDSVSIENKIHDEAEPDEFLYNKVGVSGAKFDKEAIEADTDFTALIELSDASDEEYYSIMLALSAIDSGLLRIGSKTTRGYGQLKITYLKRAEFTLEKDREKWLGFDQYDLDSDNCYNDITGTLSDYSIDKYCDTITLHLKQKGALSIRSYTVKDVASADYMQLSDSKGTPVIPGTSWAGVFRNRFKELSGSIELTDQLFGFVDKVTNNNKRSGITFSESRISDCVPKLITRTSIDRFSGGVKDSALYSEKTCYYGETVLEIRIMKNIENAEKCRVILSAVICDLDRGYLSVGGLTSVGRGLFEVTKMYCNGNDVTNALKNGDILKMIGDENID